MSDRNMLALTVAGFVSVAVANAASAGVSPFTETFANDNADWGTGGLWNVYEPVQWNQGSGPDGSNHISVTQNFSNFSPGPLDLALFRGQDNFDSSNGAFVGDWITGGITEFSFWVRHDAQEELKFFVRFVKAGANSPSMNYRFEDSLVQGNTWTKLTLQISPDTPNFIPGGGPGTYQNVMGDLGKIQIGIDLNPLAGIDLDFNFDLALVSMNVPGSSALMLLAVGGLFGTRRRRE